MLSMHVFPGNIELSQSLRLGSPPKALTVLELEHLPPLIVQKYFQRLSSVRSYMTRILRLEVTGS